MWDIKSSNAGFLVGFANMAVAFSRRSLIGQQLHYCPSFSRTLLQEQKSTGIAYSNLIQILFKSELNNFHFSDMWAAYNGIANLAVAPAYTHFTVNHSVLFHQFYKLMKYQIT